MVKKDMPGAVWPWLDTKDVVCESGAAAALGAMAMRDGGESAMT